MNLSENRVEKAQEPIKTETKIPGKEKTVRVIRYFFKMYPGQSILLSVGLLISGLLEGLGVGALLPLLEIVIKDEVSAKSPLGSTVQRGLHFFRIEPSLGFFLVFVLASFLAKSALTFLVLRFAAFTSAKIAADQRFTLLRSLMKARWDFFLSQPTGKISSAFSTESEQSANSYFIICNILAQSIQVVIYITLAFMISWRLSFLVLVMGGVGVAALNIFVKRMHQASVRFVNSFRFVVHKLTDALQGIKPMKAMALEDRSEPLLASDIEGLKWFRFKAEMSKISLSVLQEPFKLVTGAACFYIALAFFKIDFEVLAVSFLVFIRILARTGQVQVTLQNLVRQAAMFWSLHSLIQEADSEHDTLSGGNPPVFKEDIRLKGVTFNRGSQNILKNVTMDIPAGKITMLIGPSGSGKTTVADLIVGLIRPQEGDVLIDSVPLERLDIKAWRSMMGYVPQEMFLFHDSVLRNVTLNDPYLGIEETEAALRDAGAWEFTSVLPHGVHSVVGERGAKLSGGQRQRIAIARALIRKPKLLIMDEATSGLDPHTEESLLENLRNLKDPITIFVISHRSGFYKAAERVYTIEEGKIKLCASPARSNP